MLQTIQQKNFQQKNVIWLEFVSSIFFQVQNLNMELSTNLNEHQVQNLL